MARKPRLLSSTDIFHVMIRGNNKQLLFEDNEDKEYFLYKLRHYKSICNCVIYAYCLMDNHVHILIKAGPDGISTFMKRLSNSYVYWFNNKYDRSGHLLQGRFQSEVVETEQYFVTVLRYIHKNPVKAGIVNHCKKYKYSSYNNYIKKGGSTDSLTDTKLCLSLMSLSNFKEFHNETSNDECLDIKNRKSHFMTDSCAKKTIQNILSFYNITQLHEITKSLRNELIKLFRSKGMSINQLCRLTGFSKSIVSHASPIQ